MRINLKLLIMMGMTLGMTSSLFSQTRPVQGTWVNLPYQDVRNKYMNPYHVDFTNPEFWEAKVKEQAELGIKYVVIMAVANEEKAYYPSKSMAWAYDKSKKSPVDAILDAASEHGVKVFMSTGWAIDQDDNLADPKIRAMQLRIMEETASIYKNHSAFYGWYLPVEDSMEPILPEHAVEAVNFLTKRARSLTPDKKIMVSPYGICNAELDNPAFAAQIKKLTVDIIAYQDEVGCVREPQPLPRMKENFKKLGQIHKGTNIEFWANVESFTWEKDDNSRESALIPAAFPRYLAQMTAATEAGAKQIISFSTYGIYEKADSKFPIGQPTYSNKVVESYNSWKSNDSKWKLLEATFRNSNLNQAKISSVILKGKQHPKLADKILAEENSKDSRWTSLGNSKESLIINLPHKQRINNVGLRFLNYGPDGIALPQFVHLNIVQSNGNKIRVKTIAMDQFPNNRFDAWIDIALFENINMEANKIEIEVDAFEGKEIRCDEVIVNAKY